jgi:hypothetical protein
MEMPLPAPAIKAANMIRYAGPRLGVFIGYRGECSSGIGHPAIEFG